MVDPSPNARLGHQDDRPPGVPRWMKVFGAFVLGLILLFVVLKLIGVGGRHGPGRHGGATGAVNDAIEIAIAADKFAFEPREITVRLGDDVAIVLTSVDVLHDFTIDELGAHVTAKRGETATGGFRADRAGRYTFYCAEPGHRQAGMVGTLIVEGGGHTRPADGHS